MCHKKHLRGVSWRDQIVPLHANLSTGVEMEKATGIRKIIIIITIECSDHVFSLSE